MARTTIPFHVSSGQYAKRMTYIVIGSDYYPEYIGEAAPCDQRKTQQPVWRIMKITYDSKGNALSILWAGGDARFNKVWTDRTTYTY